MVLLNTAHRNTLRASPQPLHGDPGHVARKSPSRCRRSSHQDSIAPDSCRFVVTAGHNCARQLLNRSHTRTTLRQTAAEPLCARLGLMGCRGTLVPFSRSTADGRHTLCLLLSLSLSLPLPSLSPPPSLSFSAATCLLIRHRMCLCVWQVFLIGAVFMALLLGFVGMCFIAYRWLYNALQGACKRVEVMVENVS